MELVGKVLIAMPSLGDPRFHRSVILMCDYDDGGAMGIMINKPASQTSMSDLLQQLQIEISEGFRDQLTYFGGPVEMGRGFVLHDGSWAESKDIQAVGPDVNLSTTQAVLRAMARGRGPVRSKVALGYAGWAAGQLEEEIKENAWVVAEASPQLIYDTAPSEIWSEALASIGVSVHVLTAEAGRA